MTVDELDQRREEQHKKWNSILDDHDETINEQNRLLIKFDQQFKRLSTDLSQDEEEENLLKKLWISFYSGVDYVEKFREERFKEAFKKWVPTQLKLNTAIQEFIQKHNSDHKKLEMMKIKIYDKKQEGHFVNKFRERVQDDQGMLLDVANKINIKGLDDGECDAIRRRVEKICDSVEPVRIWHEKMKKVLNGISWDNINEVSQTSMVKQGKDNGYMDHRKKCWLDINGPGYNITKSNIINQHDLKAYLDFTIQMNILTDYELNSTKCKTLGITTLQQLINKLPKETQKYFEKNIFNSGYFKEGDGRETKDYLPNEVHYKHLWTFRSTVTMVEKDGKKVSKETTRFDLPSRQIGNYFVEITNHLIMHKKNVLVEASKGNFKYVKLLYKLESLLGEGMHNKTVGPDNEEYKKIETKLSAVENMRGLKDQKYRKDVRKLKKLIEADLDLIDFQRLKLEKILHQHNRAFREIAVQEYTSKYYADFSEYCYAHLKFEEYSPIFIGVHTFDVLASYQITVR